MANLRFRIGTLLLIVCTAACSIGEGLAISLHFHHGGQKVSKIFLYLNWNIDASFAGPLVAKRHGFWTGHGLDVDIQAGGGQAADPIDRVTRMPCSFGVAGASQVMMAVANGKNITAVAVDFQQSPVCWIVKRNSGIKGPKDFEGRTVATKADAESWFAYRALLKARKVRPWLIHEIPVEFGTQNYFDRGVEVYPCYSNIEPINAEARNVHVTALRLIDFGFAPYCNVLFTSRDFLQSNPHAVSDFVDGYVKGWQQARANVADAVEALIPSVATGVDRATLQKQVRATCELLIAKSGPLVTPDVGRMSLAGWERTKDVLVASGDLPHGFDVRGVFYEALPGGSIKGLANCSGRQGVPGTEQ